jgi:hypothetical protein
MSYERSYATGVTNGATPQELQTMASRLNQRKSRSEVGSIAPLILAYFSLVMTAIFLISNVASVYIARRELINVTETALSKAAQELDEFAYYYRVPIPEFFGNDYQQVPINCSDAGVTLRRELELASRNLDGGIETDTSWGLNETEGSNGTNTRDDSKVLNGGNSVGDPEPELTFFGCNGAVLQARVRQEHPLPFALNIFGIRSYVNHVSVSVEARFS